MAATRDGDCPRPLTPKNVEHPFRGGLGTAQGNRIFAGPRIFTTHQLVRAGSGCSGWSIDAGGIAPCVASLQHPPCLVTQQPISYTCLEQSVISLTRQKTLNDGIVIAGPALWPDMDPGQILDMAGLAHLYHTQYGCRGGGKMQETRSTEPHPARSLQPIISLLLPWYCSFLRRAKGETFHGNPGHAVPCNKDQRPESGSREISREDKPFARVRHSCLATIFITLPLPRLQTARCFGIRCNRDTS